MTGEQAWAFDAGVPGRIGAPPEGEGYTPSLLNSWAPISADEQLGLVYMPMGGAMPDAYGGRRRTCERDVGSAVVALDAETDRMRWRSRPPTTISVTTTSPRSRRWLTRPRRRPRACC